MSRRHRPAREALHAATAVAGAVAVTVGLVMFLGRDGADPAAPTPSTTRRADPAVVALARSFEQRMRDAFAPVVDALPRTMDAVDALHDGTATVEAARAEATAALAAFTVARDRVRDSGRFDERPAVAVLYLATAQLYVESARALLVALDAPAGAWRDQAERLSRRLRILGDRIYDRGRALLDPELGDPFAGDDGVMVQRAEEVPDWTAEGLAAGPPLDDEPLPPAARPPGRAAARPDQPVAAWVRAVAGAGVPTARTLARAIEAPDARTLRELARDAVAAAERLRAEPDPRGDREQAARARLAVLLVADAARAAQLVIVPDAPASAGRLRDVARRVALVSDDVWGTAQHLDARAVGFDRSLLGRDGP